MTAVAVAGPSTPSPHPQLPPARDAVDPLSSVTALAAALDASGDDVALFLNALVPPSPSPASGPSRAPDLGPIDRTIGELLTRLALLSQDTSSSLEQAIHDVGRTVPRLTYDLQFMRESAGALQSSLDLVQARVKRQSSVGAALTASSGAGAATGPTALVDGETDEAACTRAALDRLAHLDTLKTRMESARDILREAESWSTLEGEVAAHVSAGAWARAADRLAEAGRSLAMFANTPGEYAARRALLVSLQNQLEAALSAALRDALAAADTDACARFHRIFETMDRAQEFRNYYFDARRAPIVDEWGGAMLLENGQEGAAKLSAFLPSFYALVLSTLNTERTQVPLVFEAEPARPILASFLQTTLDGLSPSLHDRLTAAADYHGAEALPELLRCFGATEDVVAAVHATLDKLESTPAGTPTGTGADAGGVTPASPALAAASARARRFSLSLAPAAVPAPAGAADGLNAALLEPFLELQASYASLERRYLSARRTADGALADRSARALPERAAAAFAMADDAVARCLAFTKGFGAPGLVDAVDAFLSAVIAETSLDALDARDGAGGADGAAGSGAGLRGDGGGDELDAAAFDGLDYSPGDWAAFQRGLAVLRACRGVRDRLSAFERQLHAAVRAVDVDAARAPGAPPALALLRASPLDSAALRACVAGPPPLAGARDALAQRTRAVQLALQRTALAPLEAALAAYPSLPVWGQPARAPARRGELAVPTFSLSPTDTVARVAEGLLNLLRVFEVVATDDALAFSPATLPHIDEIPGLSDGAEVPAPDAAAAAAADLAPELVLSTWVSSLALSLLSTLTRRTLPALRALSTPGAAQLAADLAYLGNAVRALDVESAELERWRAAAEADEAAWRAEKAAAPADKVWAAVGRLRGWA